MDLYKIYSTALKKLLMTSREIIIKLIDEHQISGEEAFTLINDIVAAEIYEATKTLFESKSKSSTPIKWEDYSINSNPNIVWTTSPSLTGTSSDYVVKSTTTYGTGSCK